MSADATRSRDAARSREAILRAAEGLFAERGLDRTSLADVGAAAGLSRGAPGYFFGSKDALYAEVLEAAFAARDEALRPAFAELGAWAAGGAAGEASLDDVLRAAIGTYLRFLDERPAFVALMEREALAGGERLARTPHESSAIEDALRALRDAAPRHGLRRFDVAPVLVTLVSLCVFPLAHRRTLLPSAGVDADDPAFLVALRDHVAGVVAHLVREPPGR